MIARPRDHVTPLDLPALAEMVARWADDRPHVWRACVVGSRVRGDHRPGSDLDVAVQRPPGGISPECVAWWRWAWKEKNEAFAGLRAAVRPIELHLTQAVHDPAHAWVNTAALDVGNAVLRLRKVVCLWTPPSRK